VHCLHSISCASSEGRRRIGRNAEKLKGEVTNCFLIPLCVMYKHDRAAGKERRAQQSELCCSRHVVLFASQVVSELEEAPRSENDLSNSIVLGDQEELVLLCPCKKSGGGQWSSGIYRVSGGHEILSVLLLPELSTSFNCPSATSYPSTKG
jgi:hypothetical protein